MSTEKIRMVDRTLPAPGGMFEGRFGAMLCCPGGVGRPLGQGRPTHARRAPGGWMWLATGQQKEWWKGGECVECKQLCSAGSPLSSWTVCPGRVYCCCASRHDACRAVPTRSAVQGRDRTRHRDTTTSGGVGSRAIHPASSPLPDPHSAPSSHRHAANLKRSRWCSRRWVARTRARPYKLQPADPTGNPLPPWRWRGTTSLGG